MENSPFSGEFGKTRDELVLFGIPERGASIYLALLIIGESKAGEIATKLSMRRLDVYHDLKNLQSKDMVEESIEKPMKFNAVPLENVLTVLQNKDRELVRARTNALLDLREVSQKLATISKYDKEKNVSSGNYRS